MARPPVALTIAGSDSGGGAGIQADLKTFEAFRVFGASALTAVTAQDTRGVHAVAVLDPDLVAAQVRAVRDDLGVQATKVGMLGDEPVVRRVASLLAEGRLGPVVLDPVMRSKHGDPLLAPGAEAALREALLPLVDVLTPNLPEAAALLGCRTEELVPLAARREAARALRHLGPRTVVVKGGHGEEEEAVDVWSGRDGEGTLRAPRWTTPHTHGTGCTFSAAIAAGLAHGWPLGEALQRAKAYVTWAIRHAPGLGHGHGPLGHRLSDDAWEALRRGEPIA
jgi:hydroxymethylpyrimidine/phosphomethylpyrimidine kinase